MRIPARCNKRSCQARRNLSKRPELYRRWPTCHIAGCDGKMYVDKYRLRKGPKDRAPMCRDSTCPFHYPNSKDNRMPHTIATKGCNGYQKYISDRNSKPRSKHSPIPESEWIPF